MIFMEERIIMNRTLVSMALSVVRISSERHTLPLKIILLSKLELHRHSRKQRWTHRKNYV